MQLGERILEQTDQLAVGMAALGRGVELAQQTIDGRLASEFIRLARSILGLSAWPRPSSALSKPCASLASALRSLLLGGPDDFISTCKRLRPGLLSTAMVNSTAWPERVCTLRLAWAALPLKLSSAAASSDCVLTPGVSAAW